MKKIVLLIIFSGITYFGNAAAGFFGIGGGLLSYTKDGGTMETTSTYGNDLGDCKTLVLNGGYIHTYKNSGGNICGGNLYYRVYVQGSPSGSYSQVALSFSSDHSFTTVATPTSVSSGNTGDQRWGQTTGTVDLLSGLTRGTTYTIEYYWDASGEDFSGGCSQTYDYNNLGLNFTVDFTPVYTNIASGTSNCDGSWDDTDCWVGGVVPGNLTEVVLSEDMSIDASATAYVGDLTIPSGVTLTFGANAVLDINNSRLVSPTSTSELLVDGTVSTDNGTVHFSDGGSLSKTSGTVELYAMTTNYNGGGSTVSVNNNLKIYGGISTNWSSAINLNSNELEMAGGNMTFGANAAFFSNLGLVSFTGSGSQEIIGYGEFPSGLTINKPSGDVLQQYWFQGTTRRGVSITGGALTLTNGNLDGSGVISGWSGSTNIGSSATISGSSTGYVKGGVTQNVSSSSVTFPVGNSTYNPVVISNSGTADDFTISVEDYVTDDGTSGGTAVTSKAINRTWSITEATAGGSNASVTIQWGSADELTGFAAERTADNVYVSHYTGGAWSPATAGAVTGTDPYTLTMTGLTSFSPFGIGGGGALPVSLISFDALFNEDEMVELDWTTASEINSSHFNVYRSHDGVDREWIGDKHANGNSSEINKYEFVDNQPIQGQTFYFLESVDFDGETEWFGPVSVSTERNTAMETFVNASSKELKLVVPEELVGTQFVLKLSAINGQSILEQEITPSENETISVQLQSLNTGIYLLQVVGRDQVYSKKLRL